MEISQSTDDIQDFARRKGIDLKYLVDGANFVISRMHFNAGNNYYITLGLPGNAQADEIRERWKRLMLLYHPDRQSGAEDLVSERAKKVNEAYSILKDEQKRAAFDRELVDMALRDEHRDMPPKAARMRPARASSGMRQAELPAFPLRKYFTKILLLFYILCFAGVAGFFLYQKNTPDLESQLRPDERSVAVPEARNSAAAIPSDSRPFAFADSRPGAGDSARGSLPAEPEPAREKRELKKVDAAPPPVREAAQASLRVSTEQKKEQTASPEPQTPKAGALTSGPQDAVEKKPASVTLDRLLKPIILQPASPAPVRPAETAEPEARKEVLARAEPAAQIRKPEEKAPAVPDRPDSRPQAEARPQVPAGQKGGGITREEVDEFMRRYIRAYEKSDLDGIMTLFSQAAVENNHLRHDDIRKAYRMAFDGKINYYQLRDLDVKYDGPAVLVSGLYSINRYTAAEDRWAKFSGRISWKIIREQNGLKILSLNYDK